MGNIDFYELLGPIAGRRPAPVALREASVAAIDGLAALSSAAGGKSASAGSGEATKRRFQRALLLTRECAHSIKLGHDLSDQQAMPYHSPARAAAMTDL